ncbi:MAG: YdiU family protein [Halobacteriovoraceae bacterium]|nr:YdiU family protein [Halobacteriovoraceae bacterium]MCB9093628.1 YdiU family protein [Halobacteriovoraceae bacterium]
MIFQKIFTFYKLVFLFFIVYTIPTFAQIHPLDDGENSIKFNLENWKGAKLVLVNYQLAAELGYSVDDPEKLERELLADYAITLGSDGTKQGIATYYGNATNKRTGDGRAVITGVVKNKASEYFDTDILVKGTGKTPLAQASSHDGLLGLREAVHSFIISKRNAIHGFRTTQDLCVIKLPIKKKTIEGKTLDAAISVRVGSQIRAAHLGAIVDDTERFAKIFDLMAKRTLNLPANTRMTPKLRQKFITKFIENLAYEFALYKDSYFYHGMLSPSNMNGIGGSLDYGTARQMDGNHLILPNDELKYRPIDQVEVFAEFAGLIPRSRKDKYFILGALGESRNDIIYQFTQEFIGQRYDLEELKALYQKNFEKNLASLWLKRAGLSDNMLVKLDEKTISKFYELYEPIFSSRIKYIEKKTLWDYITFKSFEYQKAEVNSNKLLSEILNIDQVVLDEFSSQYTVVSERRSELVNVIKEIQSSMTEKEYNASQKRAKEFYLSTRINAPESDFRSNPFISKAENDLYKGIKKGTSNFSENSKNADSIVYLSSFKHNANPESLEKLKLFCPAMLIP